MKDLLRVLETKVEEEEGIKWKVGGDKKKWDGDKRIRNV